MNKIFGNSRGWVTCLVISGLALSFSFQARAQAQDSPSTLPNFTFYKFDGNPFTPKDVSPGTRSFFILFDVGCEHCQREILSIGEHYKEFKNTSFYMVTLDQKPAVDKFMNYYGRYLHDKPNVILLQDKKYEFISKFLPKRYPGLFIYSPDKKLLLARSGQTPLQDLLKVL